MSTKARELGVPFPTAFDAVHAGATVQNVTVATAQTVCYVAIGAAPDADAVPRFRLAPLTPEYRAVVPGVSKISAKAGATKNLSSAVGSSCTVVRLFYDDGAGQLEIEECG
jgi:hypothetical protein